MGLKCDFKIVLLGCEQAGKTCLANRYIDSTFKSKLPSTVGAMFFVKCLSSNGKTYCLGIWDTAGSERYEALSRVYYRDANAAILCYDPTDHYSWIRLKFWFSELNNQEENCKVYLCGTKKDLLDAGRPREVPEDLVHTYSLGVQGHFMTSSKTGENVDMLFQRIVDDCSSDPRVLQRVTERQAENVLLKQDGQRDSSIKTWCAGAC